MVVLVVGGSIPAEVLSKVVWAINRAQDKGGEQGETEVQQHHSKHYHTDDTDHCIGETNLIYSSMGALIGFYDKGYMGSS